MAQWFYGENGQQIGPVEDAEFSALMASQRITPGTMVWREGMPGWAPLAHVQASGGLLHGSGPMMLNMMNPSTSGLSIASLVLGIAGLITCIIVLGIPAVICGHMALHQISNSPVPMVGRGMAIAGLVCGYLTTLMSLAFLGFFIFSIASNH